MTQPSVAHAPRIQRMDAWRRRFVRIVLLATLGIQAPFAVLLFALATRGAFARYAALLAGAAFVVANTPLLYRLSNWTDHTRASWQRIWLFETPFYIHFVACLVFGPLGWLAMIGLTIAHLAGIAAAPNVLTVLAPLYAASLALGAYATLVRRFWTPTRTITVPVRDLPPALDGYTLVQLSDLHCGPYLPRAFYRRLARRASALKPDAILLTGDMVTHGAGYLTDVTDFVRHLSARAGVFASLGNHDYFGLQGEVGAAMSAGGAHVLQNDGLTIETERDGGIYLAAIDDSWTHRDDVTRALARRNGSAACVLLAHDPSTFPAIAQRADVDLVLSGHTHGGQFAVPFVSRRWNLARVRYAFTAGLYRSGSTHLYVHSGNGTSGPPARIGAAPEIARLVLRRAA